MRGRGCALIVTREIVSSRIRTGTLTHTPTHDIEYSKTKTCVSTCVVVAYVKVTWHATAANQYRGDVGCVRWRGGSERRRSSASQCVRGRQPHLVGFRERRTRARTLTNTLDTHPRRCSSTGRFAFDAVCLLRDGWLAEGTRIPSARYDGALCVRMVIFLVLWLSYLLTRGRELYLEGLRDAREITHQFYENKFCSRVSFYFLFFFLFIFWVVFDRCNLCCYRCLLSLRRKLYWKEMNEVMLDERRDEFWRRICS